MTAVATPTINGFALRSNPNMERKGILARKPLSAVRAMSPVQRNAEFQRSASYTYLPEATKEPPYSNPSLVTIKGSFSEVDLIAPTDELVDISPPDSSGWTTPDESYVEQKVPADQARDLILQLQKSPKITVERYANLTEDASGRSSFSSSTRRPSAATSIDSGKTTSTAATTPTLSRPRAGTQNSFSRVKRRSWQSSPSRSPSPPKKSTATKSTPIEPYIAGANGEPTFPEPAKLPRSKSFLKRMGSSKSARKFDLRKDVGSDLQGEDGRPTSSGRSLLSRKKSRNAGSTWSGREDDDTPIPPVPALPHHVPSMPKSFSTDRLPTFRSHTPQFDRAAPAPRLVSSDRQASGGLTMPMRRRDELWSVFRTLDGDYTKFASKSVAFKANVVRTSLLPFLRQYSSHPSNKVIRPEDLDRRANILNKWWTGLIEMLHGRNNQSISGTDRPAILDGISGILERPEWRLAPSPFCPLNDRMKGAAATRNQSNNSLSSDSSSFLTESVYHNVRNIFIQNLSAQMAFVVDKMSLRNASASLVTFCGKACAYAFMFVPGMADVLVRLWDLQMDTLRRVLHENDIGKFDDITSHATPIVSNFPPALHALSFASLMKYMRKLRTPPPLPLGTANIQWWGHWLERWTGRDSDLFYVFAKYYHILAVDFLPEDCSKRDRMCAPGLLLVHAQILTNLDATIHREAAPASIDPSLVRSTPTFDDVLAENPDAVATPVALPPSNAVRIMAENRLIMLVRDFLSERTAEHPVAREVFAESFNSLMQTAARGTSIFDHAACYTLLDFLEEALVILVRYEHMKSSPGTLINSAFWQEVCRKMISSQNTMTEVRLYAFLYTIWNTVVCDLGRKADLCIGLLLDKDVFESRFCHWCPMVRAYFMRLICWRVGRYDGEAGEGDVLILKTLQERLQGVWGSFLYLQRSEEGKGSGVASTIPCNPAPGRRLLIIRTDTQPMGGRGFLSFDGSLAKTASPVVPAETKRFSTITLPDAIRPQTANSIIGRERAASDAAVATGGFSSDSNSSGSSTTSAEKSAAFGRDDGTIAPPDDPREARGITGFLRRMMGGAGTSKVRSKSQGAPVALSSPSSKVGSFTQQNAQAAKSTPELLHSLQRAATDDVTQMPPSPVRQAASVGPTVATDATTKPVVPGTQKSNFSFRFSLEHVPAHHKPPGPLRLLPPRLPGPAQQYLNEHHPRQFRQDSSAPSSSSASTSASSISLPLSANSGKSDGLSGESLRRAGYSGRALAEWTIILGEWKVFAERRMREGVEGGWKGVETPGLGVEVFRRPS